MTQTTQYIRNDSTSTKVLLRLLKATLQLWLTINNANSPNLRQTPEILACLYAFTSPLNLLSFLNSFRMKRLLLLPISLLFFLFACDKKETLTGHKWHKATLSFQGPATGEMEEDNPFLNYRLQVTFSNGENTYIIPGFYAADGNAGKSGAEAGNVWQVRFVPDEEGTWQYSVSFRKGEKIAINDDPEAGEGVSFDGQTGTLEVAPVPADAKGFHAKGRLHYTGDRYLRFAETGEYFLKGGADSPENFLAFRDFDNTYMHGDTVQREGEAKPAEHLHEYAAHVQDWRPGDPVWHGDKGKGLIGALNYLPGKGMNSVYFLTMNIEGDGKDVWPYVRHDERSRFDVSKLDQWEMVFDHMDNLGLMLHLVLQETENELLLDNCDTGPERKLYYRELIARFAHHLAITWNMGEENGPANFSPRGQDTRQQKDMVQYIKDHNPYPSFVVIHTHSDPNNRQAMYDQLLGFAPLNGPSLQIGNIALVYEETKTWLQKSAASGNQWVVNIDEIGPHFRGVDPDARQDNNQDTVRHLALWGNLMAGGGGAEWYFGYKNPHNDLGMEDWRSRDRMWDYTRHALQFFRQHLPFPEMQSEEGILSGPGYALSKRGELLAVYLAKANAGEIDLTNFPGEYRLQWYNPRQGGDLQAGSVGQVKGGGKTRIGSPPADPDKDWALLVKKI
ncbi:hypothetical protein BH24BAC1_BH24BAC1_05470 [soil metagenome]